MSGCGWRLLVLSQRTEATVQTSSTKPRIPRHDRAEADDNTRIGTLLPARIGLDALHSAFSATAPGFDHLRQSNVRCPKLKRYDPVRECSPWDKYWSLNKVTNLAAGGFWACI